MISQNTYDNAKWYALEQKILDEYNTANGTSLTSLDGVASDIVLPIKVNGVYWSMHSDYFFDLKKTYTKEPKRGLDGSIKTFPEKFFVPYFKIKYAVIFVSDYYKVMRDIMADEVEVQYYDSFDRVYRVAKFYAQQPTYSTLYTMKGKYQFVQDLEIIFAGTKN